MKSSINCNFCKSLELEKLYEPVNSRRGSKVYICEECGLLQSIHETKEKRKKISISCDADWGNIRHGKKARLQQNVSFIQKKINFISIKNCLDIGSNRGDFVKWLRKNYPHIKITTVEPDISLIDYENIGVEIVPTKFESAPFNKKKYDFIYCCHTLEHADCLTTFLENCYKILNRDGYLFIDVPNAEIITYDRNIVEEFFIDKHNFHFIPETLIHIFNLSGFRVINKEIDTYNISLLLVKDDKKTNLSISKRVLNKEKQSLHIYQKKLQENRKVLRKICDEKLKTFLQRQRVGFWGASRIFDALIKYGGINKDLVYILVDKFISQILREVHGIPVKDPVWLKIYEPHVIFVLARSSSNTIETIAHEMGFRWVVTFDELMEQARLL